MFGIFQQAFDLCLLPEGIWFVTMLQRCGIDVEDLQRPRRICPTLAAVPLNYPQTRSRFSMFGLSWLTGQNRISYTSAKNSRLRFFRNPYDMGRSRNCQEVFGPELKSFSDAESIRSYPMVGFSWSTPSCTGFSPVEDGLFRSLFLGGDRSWPLGQGPNSLWGLKWMFPYLAASSADERFAAAWGGWLTWWLMPVSTLKCVKSPEL